MFWKRFYELCISKNTKPNPVAKDIGISSGVVTKWKNGTTIPNGETLIKIADYLDCSVDYLLGRTDNPEVNKWNEVITIQKTAYVSGYCPFLDEEVTIKATYAMYAPLGTEPMATPTSYYCEHGNDCQQGNNCPIFDQTFPWNEI